MQLEQHWLKKTKFFMMLHKITDSGPLNAFTILQK